MAQITPFDWQRMFFGNEPPLYFLEIGFRVVTIYIFAVLALRFMGKRRNCDLSPFENVVIIALGSAAGDSMFYPEIPLLYAFLVIMAVVDLGRVLAFAQIKAKSINSFLEGNPRVMIKEGTMLQDALRAERMRPDELMGILRVQGIENTGEVRMAFLERSGELGVFRYSDDQKRPGESTFPAETAQ